MRNHQINTVFTALYVGPWKSLKDVAGMIAMIFQNKAPVRLSVVLSQMASFKTQLYVKAEKELAVFLVWH